MVAANAAAEIVAGAGAAPPVVVVTDHFFPEHYCKIEKIVNFKTQKSFC